MEKKMSKPFFDQISSIIRLRREYPLMDKVIRGYNAHHNLDYQDQYVRNLRCAEMLKDVEIVNPNAAKAIQSEIHMFHDLIVEMDQFYIQETGKQIRHLELGGWWYFLLDKPSQMFLPSGRVDIEPSNDYERNYSEGYGDGICSSLTNDKIRVTLEGELTFKEALTKHRGEE